MLTDAELTQMRSVASTALPGTALIQTVVYTDNGGGGASSEWTTSGTVPCRLAPISGDESLIGGRITAESTSIVTLPHGTDVDPNARLLIGGGTFNVTAVRSRSWDVSTRVEVREET